MFKKPSVKTVNIPVINLDNFGTDKPVKKAVFRFVPLFRITKDGPGLSLEDIQDGIYGWFKYQVRTKGDEPGKIKTIQVSWMNTLLVAGKDDATLSDPGLTLGLATIDRNGNTVPNKNRKLIMGMGVPGLGFQDPNAYKATVRIPVIWDVEPNDDVDGNINPESGRLALLELKENQLNDLVAEMAKVTKPGVNYEYYVGKESKQEKYPYVGYGYAYTLDKNTERGMKTYQWSKTDMLTSKAMWESRLEEAVKLFEGYKTNAYEVGRPYESVIQECNDGLIPFEQAERIVVATIAKKLLDAWGVPYGDTTEDILEVFNEVVPNFSYNEGAGISQVGGEVKRVEIPDEDDSSEDAPF